MMKSFATVVLTAILTSAFWIFFFNVSRSPQAEQVRVDGAAPRNDPLAPLDAPDARPQGQVGVAPSGLAIPVAGVRAVELTDTFTAARAGGARTHDAIDIMAPEGTPVYAAAPGTIEKLFNSVGKGGITAYERSEDGQFIYYYAHLSAYAAGLAEGQKVARGAPIGSVGHTGDASPDGPHLHFAINRMAAGERWWQGTPINPYPLLAGKSTAR